MNEVDAPVVAADIASGVNASTGEVEGAAIGDASANTEALLFGRRTYELMEDAWPQVARDPKATPSSRAWARRTTLFRTNGPLPPN